MKYRPAVIRWWTALLALVAVPLHAQPDPFTALEASFRNPPDAAKPRTWWHWTNSNVTREGITKDLEWMKRAGIGGFQLADVAFGRGQVVEPKTQFGTPEWYEAVRHAAAEADRLGLEMAVFSSPGWSITGGPWVTPAQAMKKVVWSELQVTGPQKFSGMLPAPPSNNGPIRNLRTGRPDAPPEPGFHADSAVVAYRLPAAEAGAGARPVVTAGGGGDVAAALLDDDLNSAATIPAPADGGPAWVQYEFSEPFTARAFTIAGRGGIPVGRLLAGDDGVKFAPVLALPGAQLYRQGSVRTFAFAPVTARFFRLELTGAPIRPAETMSEVPPQPAKEYVLTEAVLHAGARVNRAEEKAVFSFLFQYETVPTPAAPADAVIDPAGIVDLTDRLRADGTLEWDVPEGRWVIQRFGASLTGAKNRPATPAGSGLEADKLSRAHMESYYHGFFDPLEKALGPLYGKSLSHVLIDSWEAGYQNWTETLPADFRARRGYELRPFLPALAGRIVGDAETTDRFLWDFRRTLADLWAENHYGLLADLLRAKGLRTYSEASGVSLEIPEDTLMNKSKVDIPMGEFWVRDLHPRLMYFQDVRGAASAAHVYGKTFVAAEAFTGGGYESPATLQRTANYWFAQGLNRLVFHTSAHQPLDTKPGNTMVGTHLHRNITWAELALPLNTHFARISHVLQQGRPVADIAYLLAEGAPSTPVIWGAGTTPAPPEGFDYDFINADVLLHRLTVDAEGRLAVPDGPAYRVLVLPETDRMRPELARMVRNLVAGGATVVGPRPVASPSLQGGAAADAEVRALALEVWGDLDGASRTIRHFGKGRVVWGRPLAEVLAAGGVAPDFEYARGLDAEVAWAHRRVGNGDIYFVANTTGQAREFEARFRVAGRDAELWRPDTGRVELADFRADGDRTIVPLRLGAHEAAFVVFRRNATGAGRSTPRAEERVLGAVEGAWEVAFPAGLGAPERVNLPALASWTGHSEEGVKHFSGTAAYTRALDAPAAWFEGDHALVLDLGRVGDLAEVFVNGRRAGLAWKEPFEVDVTGLLRPGSNALEVRVTNQWTNRLVGDRSLPAERKVLGETAPAPGGMRAGAAVPLPESGLLGPVLVVARQVNRVADAPDGVVAEIPVNYTEAKAGTYALPDALTLASGRRVKDAKAWRERRRPEIVKLYEEHQFGRAPGRPPGLNFDVFEKSAPALDGRAVRRQVTVWFTKARTGPKMEVLVYLPAGAKGPVPLLLQAGFSPNNHAVDDPGVKVGELWNREQGRRVPAEGASRRFGRLPVAELLARGIGFATINYADIDPDAPGALAHGVRALHLAPGQPEPGPGEWGTIAAWAWGFSRAMDYFETDPDIDAKRVAVFGVSRLGKTALWTGASDPRFAAVIASCSGEGGAAIARRNYGETQAHMSAPSRYRYQFALNYSRWADKLDRYPVDGHLLVSLIAPRPVLLQTGDTDRWSDPKGEFLSALAARPVFELFGKKGPETDLFPPAGVLVGDTLAYYMHAGGHGSVPSDWDVFIPFLEKHLKP